jgi:hypothetical protein
VENRNVTLGTSLDIYAAFDSTSFDIKRTGAKWHGLGDMISQWIGSVLGGRKITATLAGETLQRSVARCSMQGGPLSPLLCNPVVDELTRGLNEIHWVMQMTMLSSSTENSQAPSQSFSRRL